MCSLTEKTNKIILQNLLVINSNVFRIHIFNYGVANRAASIRIPRQCDKDGFGYFEVLFHTKSLFFNQILRNVIDYLEKIFMVFYLRHLLSSTLFRNVFFRKQFFEKYFFCAASCFFYANKKMLA